MSADSSTDRAGQGAMRVTYRPGALAIRLWDGDDYVGDVYVPEGAEGRTLALAYQMAAAPAMFEALQRALLGLVAWKEEQKREHPWSVDGWKIEEEVRAALAAALPPDPSAEGVTP